MATGTSASPRDATAMAHCSILLDRLRALIDGENHVLAAAQPADYAAIAARKNQLLRDLLVVQRGGASPQAMAALVPKVRELQEQLRRNRRLLGLHIEAVKQIAAIIVDSLRHADSDGTYSRLRRS